MKTGLGFPLIFPVLLGTACYRYDILYIYRQENADQPDFSHFSFTNPIKYVKI